MKISVVIPTLGSSPHLRGLLERLQRQVTSFPFEVLVVANIPRQDLRQLVNSMGTPSQADFDYLETGRLGVNLARNKGFERARGEIVLFLDDDVILENDNYLAAHVERHDQNPEATAIGGPPHLTGSFSSWDQVYQDLATDWVQRHFIGDIADNAHLTMLLPAGCFSVKRDSLVQHGFVFDESIGFGDAASGFFLRLVRAGHLMLFFDELRVGHSTSMGFTKFCKTAFLQGAGAAWRTAEIPSLESKYTARYLPQRNYRDWKLSYTRSIFRTCFKYGRKVDPYRKRTEPDAIPRFHFARFAWFLVRQLEPLTFLKRWHRRFYVTVRSIWILKLQFNREP